MGLEVAALCIAGVAIGATEGKMFFEYKAASEKENALDLQAKQMAIQTQQKTLANYDLLEKVVDAQIAHMTTTGTAFSSPSFNAIQRNTFNIVSKKQKNVDLEGELAQENIKIEKRNVRNSLYAQLFGDVVQIGKSISGVAGQMPTLE
jgi:hypothetical protein